MSTLPLTTRYRPASFDEVVGQDAVVSSIQASIDEVRAYLFVGPSGTGKTTLARIIANELGCTPGNIVEIDAASNAGVAEWRATTRNLNFRPVDGGKRVVIVDECHALSKAAWQSLLKTIEEPPDGVYWCLCTTEANKVPTTVQTRCSSYTLRDVPRSELEDLLANVVAWEEGTVATDVVRLCAEKARGSPRRALSYLQVAWDCEDRKEAAELLREALDDSDDAIELCRALMKGAGWTKAAAIVERLGDQRPESIRHVVLAYFTKVAVGAKNTDAASSALSVLDAFSTPYPETNGKAYLLLSIGEVLL